MYVIYIAQFREKKKHFFSKNTTKPAKPENSGIGVNQAIKAECVTFCVLKFCILPLLECSLQERLLPQDFTSLFSAN